MAPIVRMRSQKLIVGCPNDRKIAAVSYLMALPLKNVRSHVINQKVENAICFASWWLYFRDRRTNQRKPARGRAERG